MSVNIVNILTLPNKHKCSLYTAHTIPKGGCESQQTYLCVFLLPSCLLIVPNYQVAGTNENNGSSLHIALDLLVILRSDKTQAFALSVVCLLESAGVCFSVLGHLHPEGKKHSTHDEVMQMYYPSE